MIGCPIPSMEPVLWPHPFDDPAWIFQPKWDGVRIQAHVGSGQVRLFSKRGVDRTMQYPELVSQLSQSLETGTAILDGEAVVFWQDRPSFPRIMRRELAAKPDIVVQLVQSLPVTYLVFDMLYLQGRSLIDLPLEERQAILHQQVTPTESMLLTDSFPGHGRLLFNHMVERGWEGIVAKRLGSPYRAGKNQDWRKVKVKQHQQCVVGGYTLTSRGLGSLLLGAYRQNDLVYVGRAGSGLSDRHIRLLLPQLKATTVTACPFRPKPALGRLALQWVEPTLTLEVEFTEWTESLQLRHPVIKGFTSDPPSVCQLP